MNKNKKRVISIFLLGTFIFQVPAAFSLDSGLRDNFAEMTQKQLCHSSLSYSLDEPLVQAQEKYQKKINCLFNDAMAQSINHMNADFTRIWKEIPSTANFEDIERNDECTPSENMQETIKSQINNGYESMCPTEDYNPTIDKFYSACHVTETVMNEFCAYQEYIEWKILDESHAEKQFEEKTNVGFFEADRGNKGKHRAELEKSKKALFETLYRYQKWEQNYRFHMWLTTIWEALKKTHAMSTILRKAIYKFPDKFNYAASELCDQHAGEDYEELITTND